MMQSFFFPLEKQLTDETRSLIQDLDIQSMDLSQIHVFFTSLQVPMGGSCPTSRLRDAGGPNCAPSLFLVKNIRISVCASLWEDGCFPGNIFFVETGSVMKGVPFPYVWSKNLLSSGKKFFNHTVIFFLSSRNQAGLSPDVTPGRKGKNGRKISLKGMRT